MSGVRLLLLHPEVAGRSCAECIEWVFDEKTGEKARHRGEPVKRNGAPPPCRAPGGTCPKGTPEKPVELSDRNREAYRHYLECRAVGQFPDDPIVRRNAMLIRMVEDAVADMRAERISAQQFQLALSLGAGMRHGR